MDRLGRNVMFRMMKKMKAVVFFTLFFLSAVVYADSITLSSDSDTVSVDETFRFILSAEGSFDSITEPQFNDFTVENRSESQSSSISITNGKMVSKKSINYIYQLRAQKGGIFKIGPAKITLKNGRSENSNTVTITVTGSSAGTQNSGTVDNSGADSSPTPGSLLTSLTKWEKRTPNYFLRAVVEPQGDIYEGEPVTVKYYLFTRPGTLSDLNFYKSPSFDNCWKEEKQESRLSFQRAAIDGEVYDYGLLKTFVLVPEKGLQAITGTQMIIDAITGSFFNTKKQSISSPALRIPLVPIPEKEQHPNGFFGSFEIDVNKRSLQIDKDNPLDTVEYSIKGCGNFQSAEIKLSDNSELKVFAPEIDNRISTFSKGYCGEKRYKFMVKGQKTGETVLKTQPIEVYSREKGWVTVNAPEVSVTVKEIAVSVNSEDNKKLNSFELLKELPKEMNIYGTTTLVSRLWFKIVMAVPFLISLISFLVWLIRFALRKQSRSFSTKLEKWEKAVRSSNSCAELLNIFYDALKELYSIEIRGERSQALLKKHGNSFQNITEFIREIEHMSFSGQNVENLNSLKEKAVALLRFRGKIK